MLAPRSEDQAEAGAKAVDRNRKGSADPFDCTYIHARARRIRDRLQLRIGRRARGGSGESNTQNA